MKKKLLLLPLLLLINIAFASNPLSNYLIPTPQKIQYNIEKEAYTYSNTALYNLKQYLQALYLDDLEYPVRKYNHNSSSDFIIKFIIDTVHYQSQHYLLTIHHRQVTITGGDEAALFYGKQTLLQILEYLITEHAALPWMEVEDYPDFKRRGFMLDISRDKVPTMTTLYMLVDLLAEWKINEFQLYTEHTFAFRNYKEVWGNSSPMTAKEIHRLDQYCKNRFIDLVPNQNSFGHMENWLKHDQFLELAECPEDCATKWGARKRTSLDPTNSKSLDLMKELYAELLPNFSSHYFNIGCDETIELGLGRSKVLCDSLGVGVVYLNYLKQLNDEVNKYGKITQFWGDIIVNHKDLILQVPKNMIALAWGYERDHKFDRELPLFKEAGIEFYVCPGISTWRSLIGRNNTAFANIRNAAVQGKLNGAEGLLNTSWGDYGHWQPMSVSYPAIMIGASYAWNCDTTAPDRVGFQLNHYIFQDTTGNTGKALMKLGDAYLLTKIPEGVANVFHLMLHRYKWTMQGNYQTKEIKMPNLQNTENEIKEALLILDKAKPDCDDADIVLAEIRQAANLALHSLHLGIARLNTVDMETKSIPVEVKMELAKELLPLIENHKKLWLKRDRYGGLEDSAGKLQEIYDYYMLQEEILEQ